MTDHQLLSQVLDALQLIRATTSCSYAKTLSDEAIEQVQPALAEPERPAVIFGLERNDK